MIVLLRRTSGLSWQGLAIEAPEHVPASVWHGTEEKVREAFLRYSGGAEVRFINFDGGWDAL